MTTTSRIHSTLRAISSLFERPADPAFLALQASNAAEVGRFDPTAHAMNARIALARKA